MSQLVFSPSNLSTFLQCPRKFQGQSVTKELKWKATQQKSRGTLVHAALEDACKEGYESIHVWPEGLDQDFVRDRVNLVRNMMSFGAKLHIEHEMCITEDGKATDWWDEKGMMRCKADAIIVPDAPSPLLLIDFKTGKKWDEEDFQLRMEALIAHIFYKRQVVNYAYWYVDTGEVSSGTIDFNYGLTPVQDVIDAVHDARSAIAANNYPPTKNRFCKWCGFYNTEGCGL